MGPMSTKNPWQTVSTREIYRNPWIRVREDSVVRPDGNPGIYSVVEARPATGVLALNDLGNLVLVGQFRYPTNCYSWEIPEGGAEAGESPLQAVQRELKEEAGLLARHWELLAGDIQLSNCYTNERGYLFLARDLQEVSAAPDATEELAIRWVSPKEAMDMILRSELTDSLSMLAILLYLRRIGSYKD